MKERKSMRGVSVDLGKLMAQQEKNIAVGNTKSNARGDQLGRAGRVVKSADEISREHYNRNNPRAVAKTSIKLDEDVKREIEDAKKASTDSIVDDWEEPKIEEDVEEQLQEIQEEEDEWVEDAEGNFVRASELAESVKDEPVSKSKTSRKKK